MDKKKKVDLTVFVDNVSKVIVKYCAYMNCPKCKNPIFLDTDKITYCKKCRKKTVYKLKKDSRMKEGFSQLLCYNVKDFKKETLKEVN